MLLVNGIWLKWIIVSFVSSDIIGIAWQDKSYIYGNNLGWMAQALKSPVY